jgi:hypothetical protein
VFEETYFRKNKNTPTMANDLSMNGIAMIERRSADSALKHSRALKSSFVAELSRRPWTPQANARYVSGMKTSIHAELVNGRRMSNFWRM